MVHNYNIISMAMPLFPSYTSMVYYCLLQMYFKSCTMTDHCEPLSGLRSAPQFISWRYAIMP